MINQKVSEKMFNGTSPPPAKERKTTASSKKNPKPKPTPNPSLPSMSPPPAKKRKTTDTTKKNPKPTPDPSMSPPPAKKRKTTATTKKNLKPKPTPNPSLPSISPPPEKKSKTTATTKKKPTLTSLPYDLLLSCLARISVLYYPTISLVSKRFRSLLASPELYKARSLLGHTESCLYVCFNWGRSSRWYTLCRKPGKQKGYALAKVPIPDFPRALFSGLVAVGSSIYHMASSRSLFCNPTSVSILDCRSHSWREAPSMRVELMSFSASVLDRKIYVAGYVQGADSGSFKNSIEVFDTKTQIWDPEPIPCSETYDDCYHKTAYIDGKFHVVHHLCQGVVAYNSKEGRWDMVERRNWGTFLRSDSYCEIDNVLYSVYSGAIKWYDTEVSNWREVKGLVGLPKLPDQTIHIHVRLADYGGKMAVMWNEQAPYNNLSIRWWIQCAEIVLERRDSCEIWGEVEWVDHMLTIPRTYNLVKALAVTV